jgi:hypothetical protein
MISGTIDLATIERDAYQRGDMQVAQLAAIALDCEQVKSEMDDLRMDVACFIKVIAAINARIAESEWRYDGKRKLRELDACREGWKMKLPNDLYVEIQGSGDDEFIFATADAEDIAVIGDTVTATLYRKVGEVKIRTVAEIINSKAGK